MGISTDTAMYKKASYLVAFILMAAIQVILTSSTIYGFASLLVIFKELKLYHQKCDGIVATMNTTLTGRTDDAVSCQDQDKALNLPYAVGMVLQSFVKIPLGNVVDKLGAKSCQYIGSIFLLFFGACLSSVEPGKEYLIFIAFIFLAIAGSLLMLSPFQVTNILFTTKKAFCISLLSGCIDGSTVVFIIFLEVFETHVRFSTICLSYSVGTAIFIMLITHFLYPSKRILHRLVEEDIVKMMRPEDSESSEESTLIRMRSADFSASFMSSYDMYYQALHM